MSTDAKPAYPAPTEPTPSEPTPTEPDDKDCGCQPCDLEGVDGLTCRAKKYEKQAEIMKQVATDLASYKTQYGEARKAFAEAWESTTAEREEIQRQLDEIYDLLKCRLTPAQKDCLDEAAEDVFSDIEECLPDTGCCVGECEFDDEVGDDDVPALTARIEKYRRDTEANTACFTSLVAEAQTVIDRVAEIKAEVAALASVITGSSDKTKVPRWYARWLIASYRLNVARLGHGFDSVKAYSDCLCKALQCIAAGWGAIAVLEGARAEKQCMDDAEAAECKRKSEATLESILEAYECCISKQEPGEEPPAEPEYPEPKPEPHSPSQTAG
jgi:hypothetical protein